jgi:site-specific DNA recombinase
LAGESVTSIVDKARRQGWRNKQWTTRDGKLFGGSELRKQHIYSLLANVVYSGRISAGDELCPGEHEAIITRETFDLAQERLKQNGSEHARERLKVDALLRGLLYCSGCGSKMYQICSSSKERRYRYYVCLRAQQRTDDRCATRAVSAPAVEVAVVESIRRVGVHPRVLEETAHVARQRLAEETSRLREELKGVQGTVKNLKSQLARMQEPDQARDTALKAQLAAGEAQAVKLKQKVQNRDRERLDEKDLRKTLQSFDELWKAMNIEEQGRLVRLLIEKVGYDGRTGKVTVSFKSAGMKGLCQKGAA